MVRYAFETNSTKPCDLCDGMVGEYDYKLTVPVHAECRCVVTEIRDEDRQEECELEIRNLKFWEEIYFEDEERQHTNNTDDEETGDIDVELGIVTSSFDEGVEEALDWRPDYGDNHDTIVVPPHTTVTIVMQIEYTQMICSGDLWRVCTRRYDGTDMTTSTETLVGHAGGGALAKTALVAVSTYEADGNGQEEDGDPYFRDDAESPD